MATVKSLKADVFRLSPSLERLEELWGVCVYMQEMELLYWKEYADEKKVKLVE